MISVETIEQRLRDQVESLARELLPAARREGPYLKVGSLHGEAGSSLVIYLQGAKQGRWTDFADGDAHGDMLDLIGAVLGLNKGQSVAWAKDWLGIRDEWSGKPGQRPQVSPDELARRAEEARRRREVQAAKELAERGQKIRRAKALFLNTGRPLAGTPAEYYLLNRGLEQGAAGAWPGSLRYAPEIYNKDLGVKVPAMLAQVFTADGEQIATHRTFLQNCARRGWTKIDSPNARKILGPSWGGFIPISKGRTGKSLRHIGADEPVYMAEGIEKCLAIREVKPELRIIAGISLRNMGAIVLPSAARKLVIVADRDDNVREQDALERSIAQQQARGLDVSIVNVPAPHKDIDAWLLSLKQQQNRKGAT